MTPSEWKQSQVRELLAQITTGVSVNSESRPCEPGEVGVLKTSAVTYGVFRPNENKVVVRGELHRVRENPKGGCVLLSRMNTPNLVGASAYVDRDWPDLVLPDRIWQLQPHSSRTDGRWLAHFLSAPDTRASLSELASGTSGSMKNLSQEKFMRLLVPVPPLGEQKKIAAILSSVDEAIEATQAVIDQLQVAKKAMLAELLTRGLPGRHTRFKQTDIGEVPADWEVVPLGHLSELQPGFPFKSAEFVASGDRLLRGSNVAVGSLDWSPSKTVFFPPDRRAEFTDFVLEEGDIIVAMDRPFISDGFKIARVTGEDMPALLLQRVGRFRRYQAEREYIWALLHSDFVQGHLKVQQKGTDLPHISRGEVEACIVPRPSRDEQARIGAILGGLDARLEAERAYGNALSETKASLMSVLLTGEVRVKHDEEAP